MSHIDNDMSILIVSNSITSIGLLFDIAGAWLVAWEVVRQFNGQKFSVEGGRVEESNLGYNMGPPPLFVKDQKTEKTIAFKLWEIKKYKRMKAGLVCLTIGFSLQIVSPWYSYWWSHRATQKIILETNIPTSPQKMPEKISNAPLKSKSVEESPSKTQAK